MIRAPLGRLVLAGVALSAVAACERSGGGTAPVTPATGSGDGTELADAETRADREPRGEGYGRLLAATEGIPPNPLVGNAARLERARAWVDANRSDKPERERELQAQLISVMESILSDEIRLDAFGGVMEFHALELWSKDADGDGRLTESEAVAAQDVLERTVDDALIYFGDRFDTDGDGEISDEESDAANERFESSVQPVLGKLADRARFRAWDEDGDGRLSVGEREAGHARLGIDPDDPRLGTDDPEIKHELYSSLSDGFERASEFLPRGDRQAAYESARPAARPAPERTDFDFDADGSLSEVEREAFAQEQADLLESQRADSDRVIAAGVLADYSVALARMDADGDGAIVDAEWVSGFETLRAERDARIFAYFYDTDGDGVIGDAEVVRFMNAYEARSPHADADLNGRVDQNDLVAFRDRVLNR